MCRSEFGIPSMQLSRHRLLVQLWYLQIGLPAVDACIYEAGMVLAGDEVLRVGCHLAVAVLLQLQLHLPQLQQGQIY